MAKGGLDLTPVIFLVAMTVGVVLLKMLTQGGAKGITGKIDSLISQLFSGLNVSATPTPAPAPTPAPSTPAPSTPAPSEGEGSTTPAPAGGKAPVYGGPGSVDEGNDSELGGAGSKEEEEAEDDKKKGNIARIVRLAIS